jgi:hypothetical protein
MEGTAEAGQTGIHAPLGSRDNPKAMSSHEFDNTGPDGQAPTTECQCGATVPLHNSLQNACPECDRTYNGCGQRLREGTNRRRRLAQERGRDPGVGPPGHGA